jgi:hypothetical protein
MKTRVENEGLRKVLICGLFLCFTVKSVKSQNDFGFNNGADSQRQVTLIPNCPPGQKLVDKPEGWKCMEDIRRNRYQTNFDIETQRSGQNTIAFPGQNIAHNSRLHNPTLTLGEANLPDENDVFTPDQKRCFSQQKIYWPRDGHCYSLLEQGPCKNTEWLVASEVTTSSRYGFPNQTQNNLRFSTLFNFFPKIGETQPRLNYCFSITF